jgi:signal transduction histidine kinase
VNIEKLDELESDFLAGISHELRTPLTVIKESNALLLEGLGGTLSPLQLRLLEISKKNIERLSQQIDSLLDLSKFEKERRKNMMRKES